MEPGNPPRRDARPRLAAAARAAVPALAAALALSATAGAPATSLAAVSPPGDGALSPRLAELAKPEVRSAPPAEQAQALSLAAEGPGSLVREGNRVLVEVRFDEGAAAGVEDLRQAGAEVVNVSQQYQTVTVAAKPEELRALNGVPRVAGAKEVLAPITYSTCPSGEVVSEGVQQLHAGEGVGEARNVFGVNGSGVTVGLLSDSFNRATESLEGGPIATTASQDVSSGDLPGTGNTCPGETTPVGVLDDTETEGADEGRAMAQIVHDVAPGAKLAFATAFTSETAFAENIERLAKPTGEGGAGAKVIADDVSYFEEPFFQEGPVGVAVKNVTEQGVSYFSSAGNNNLIHEGRNIASWEVPQFRDAESCPAAIAAFEVEIEVLLHPTHCMDFNPSEAATDTTFGITVSKDATLIADLQWAEALEGVNADLDAFLIGPEGEVVSASGEDNPADGRPVEIFGWENETGAAANVQLVINRYSGGDPRLKLTLLQNGGGVTATEYESSSGGDVVGPTIFGHNGGEDTISMGAIRYTTNVSPETYSSRGPVTHFFGPVNGATPAPPLGSPQVLDKPDLTATDCGVTTFFAFESSGQWHFCGTSAAAPHAAGVAALMLQRDPTASPAQIRSAITESARPVGAFGPDAVGAGLVDAVGALESIPGEGIEISGGSTEHPDAEVPTPNSQQQTLPPFQPNFTPPPNTFFQKHPAKTTPTRRRTAKAVFLFGSDQSPVAFLCKVDRGLFHLCGARFVRLYRLGRHVVRVKARDSEGAIDNTPSVYRFRVVHVRHVPIKRRHARHQRHG